MPEAKPSKRPLQVFFSYAHEDEDLRDELAIQLDILERQGDIATWHDRRIEPGGEWAVKIAENLEAADLILLLVSADFLASDYIQNIELPHALERQQNNTAQVIPIILRDCLWRQSAFAQLQALPIDGKPITTWPDRDTAWLNVTESILRIAQEQRKHLPNKPELLQSIWNVPYQQNPYFTGRKALLETLHQALTTVHTTALTQAITGLGGIGKTQTALEYAYRYRKDYRIIWWLRAEEPATLAADYAQLAIEFNLPEQKATEQALQIQAVRNWLEQHTGWLLIFDNAEEQDDMDPYVPQIGNGHVIITSRNPIWDGLGTTLSVDVMQSEEALAFLAKRIEDSDSKAAATLAETLGYLPLALEQAAAYTRENCISLAQYQALFQKHHAQLLQHHRLATQYPATVATTWELAFQEVQKTAPAAADLLNLCAFLAPDAIFLDMIIEGATYLPKRLAQTITDPLALNQLVRPLLRYALVQREGHTLILHRLVQRVLRDRLNTTTQCCWAECAVQIVNQAFPYPEFSNWSRCEQLLSHARICAKWIEEWKFISEEAERLLHKMGVYLHDHEAYMYAEQFYQHLLHILEDMFEAEDPFVATSLNDLALHCKNQGQYAQAEPLYQRALGIQEKALGPEHPNVAQILNNLAELYHAQDQYAQAEPLYQRALNIHEKILGPEHPDVATSLNGLARLYHAQDQYAQAEPLYQRALDIHEKILGPEHPDLATDLNNLAELYCAQGQYAQAEPLFQRALAINEKALGPEHPDLAQSFNNLAKLYHVQDQYVQAEPLYQRALDIHEKTLGPKHWNVATSLSKLAMLYLAQGQYAQAEPLFQRALDIREKALGPKHPDLDTSLDSLAALYSAQGQYAQAEPLLQRILHIRETTLGPEHLDVASRLDSLAVVYLFQDQYAQAEPLFQRALDIREKALGPEHPDVDTSLNGLAKLYYAQGQYAQAELLLQRILHIREKTLGPEHLDVATGLNGLAVLYYAQGQYAQAEPLFQRALDISEKALGSEHPDVATIRKNLARAKPYFQRMLTTLKKILGRA